MANATTRIPGTTQAAIAGFFREENRAENAIEDLRAAGFSDSQIGVATPHEEGRVGSFWDKLSSKFGKHEHTEQASDLEESLRESGIPEQQASYFNSELGRGGVLVTVHAGPERATKALTILQQNGADVGSTAAGQQRTGPSAVSPTATSAVPRASSSPSGRGRYLNSYMGRKTGPGAATRAPVAQAE